MTKQEAQGQLEKFQAYQRRYRGYLGSPFDDCLLHIYGYTVREERAYINRQVKFYKNCLKIFKETHQDSIPIEDLHRMLWRII